jgi:hypothetical protein
LFPFQFENTSLSSSAIKTVESICPGKRGFQYYSTTGTDACFRITAMTSLVATAEVRWTLTPHLSIHFDYIFVFNGGFEEQSIHATASESYICPWITYRF